MTKVYLKVPDKGELFYRQNWMKNPTTMSYNAGYNMQLNGYDYHSGTIEKSDEEMLEWFNKWINKEPDKYFAYIYDVDLNIPVGEIYFYYQEKLNVHSMGILIDSNYRGKRYSYPALLELEKIAFEKYNINTLSDIIPIDRISAINSFKKAGFIETNLFENEIKFGKENDARQLVITKEMYFKTNI